MNRGYDLKQCILNQRCATSDSALASPLYSDCQASFWGEHTVLGMMHRTILKQHLKTVSAYMRVLFC